MRRRVQMVLGGTCLLPVLFASNALGQEQNPVSSEPVQLEKIPGLLRMSDELVLREINAFLAVADSELGGKPVSEPLAQESRLALRNIKPPIKADVSWLLRTGLLSSGNERIAKAAKDLDEAWEKCKLRRETLFKEALAEIGQRAAELARSATGAEEVESLLAAIDGFIESAQYRATNSPLNLQANAIFKCIGFLQALREMFEFPPKQLTDQHLLLEKLEVRAKAARALAPGVDVSQRISAAIQPFKSAADATRRDARWMLP